MDLVFEYAPRIGMFILIVAICWPLRRPTRTVELLHDIVLVVSTIGSAIWVGIDYNASDADFGTAAGMLAICTLGLAFHFVCYHFPNHIERG